MIYATKSIHTIGRNQKTCVSGCFEEYKQVNTLNHKKGKKMTEQTNNEAIFIYDDNNPGCITCNTGLDIGQSVVVKYNNVKYDLQDIIRFGGDGYIKEIKLSDNRNGFDYRIDAIGAGPLSGYGHIYFTDEEPDTYELKFYKHKEHPDDVRYNSKKPKIHKITWEPAGKIIPISRDAVFVYNDEKPGCITSEKGLHVGQHVVVEYNGQRYNLQDIIRFGGDGYIKEIEFEENNNGYDYKVNAIGAGPLSGYGHIYFTDDEPDTYELKFYKHEEHADYVRFNSKAPIIHKITWEPAGKIIPISRDAVFVYDDGKPGCITSEKGLHVGQRVVIEHKGIKVNLEDVIRFKHNGYIREIELEENNNSYDYRIVANGAGPTSGYGHIYFTDDEPDTYELKFFQHKDHQDYVRFNSKAPLIHKITWDPADACSFSFPNWMSEIDNSTPINTLFFPGTHDSLTFSVIGGPLVEKYAQTQESSLYEQLNYGCRYIDIRTNFFLQGVHDKVLCTSFIKDVFEELSTFLSNNPSEVILMRFKYDDGASKEFDKKIEQLYKEYESLFWKKNDVTKWPTIGDVRGKVIILDSLDGLYFYNKKIGYKFMDEDLIKLQDEYDNPSIGDKEKEIMKNFYEICPEKLKINHISAAGNSNPKTMTPREYAKILNPWTYAKIQTILASPYCLTGALVFDFINPNITEAVIKHNFKKKQTQK